MTTDAPTPPEILEALKDPWFHVCLVNAMNSTEFLSNIDRLHGTNLCRTGSPMEQMVDVATGRLEADLRKFTEFVYEYVYMRVERPKTD